MAQTQTLAPEQSALGGTVVWVKRSAEIQRTRTMTDEPHGGYGLTR